MGDLRAGVTLGDLVGSDLAVGESNRIHGQPGSTIIAWGTNAQPCVARDQAGKQETCTKHCEIFMVLIGLPLLTATSLARALGVVRG